MAGGVECNAGMIHHSIKYHKDSIGRGLTKVSITKGGVIRNHDVQSRPSCE